ncbi:MAG: Gfo/Idh/MocA family oxidoreductase [Actinomycetota bacterium]
MAAPARLAVIGAGGMGSFHARTLARIPGVEVALIADPVPEASGPLAVELGADATSDPAEAATAEGIDAVVIASPDETHAELTLAAMATGKRVLCEKPLASTVADARAVVEAETELGRRVVQVGFMREYDLAHRQVVEAIAADEPLRLIRSVHRNTDNGPRTDLLVVGQSIVHDLHSIRFMTGREIVAVRAFGSRRPDGSLVHVLVVCELDGSGNAVIEFDDDAFAYEVLVEVTIGRATVTTAGPLRATERRGGSVTRTIGPDWFGWFAEAYRIQDEAWVRSLDDDEASGPSTWDGLAAQIGVDAALRSLDDGQRVAVELPPRPALFE